MLDHTIRVGLVPRALLNLAKLFLRGSGQVETLLVGEPEQQKKQIGALFLDLFGAGGLLYLKDLPLHVVDEALVRQTVAESALLPISVSSLKIVHHAPQ